MSVKKNLATLLLTGFLAIAPAFIRHLYSDEIRKICLIPGHDSRECSHRAEGRAGREDKLTVKFASMLERKLKVRAKDLVVFRTRSNEGYSKDLIEFVKRDLGKNYLEIDYSSLLGEIAKYVYKLNPDLIINIHFDKVDHDINKIKGFLLIYSDKNLKVCESIQLAYSESKAFVKEGIKPSNNYSEDDGIIMRSKYKLIGQRVNAPAIIAELGSIDDVRLNDPSYFNNLVDAAFNGILDYKNNHKHLSD